MWNSIYASSIILLHHPDTLIIRNAITAISNSTDHRSFTKVRSETGEDRPINLIQAFPIELRQGHEIHGRNIVSMEWNWKEKYGTRRKASFTGRQFQRRFSRLALVSSDTRDDTYFESANASFNIAQVGRGLDRVALFPEKWIYIPGSADTCNRPLSLSVPRPSSILFPLSFVSRQKWVEQLQELINAKPETHPTDCVSRATKQQPDRFVSVHARFKNLMDRKKEGTSYERQTDRNSGAGSR